MKKGRGTKWGGRREGAGRPPKRGPAVGHKVWLPEAFWEYVAQWDGDNPSQQLHNALFDLERFRPHGPTAKRGREVDGRFTPHAPRLWEKGGDAP